MDVLPKHMSVHCGGTVPTEARRVWDSLGLECEPRCGGWESNPHLEEQPRLNIFLSPVS